MNIYEDIAKRTNGEIYIGVVGPVRSGKSSFIKKFMEGAIIPSIESEYDKERAKDETPQSASGKTIMTTEPKFVPDEAVSIRIGDTRMNVRLIDCVGYLIEGALGASENEAVRMVSTPWSSEPMEFEKAAELGTKKVITDHSTVGLVVTSDGSYGDFSREDYVSAERRVVNELQTLGKPFVIILNSASPESEQAHELAISLEEKYGAPVALVNVLELSTEDFEGILKLLLGQFSINEIKFMLPKYISSLDNDHWLKSSIISSIKDACLEASKIDDIDKVLDILSKNEYIDKKPSSVCNLGTGEIMVNVSLNENLYYKIISELCGTQIEDDEALFSTIKMLSLAKNEFDKFTSAIDEVNETGYGIVLPDVDDMTLEEPEIVKQSGAYGVKLRASAPSIHMIRATIETEINPIVGTAEQSQEIIKYMLEEFEDDPKKIWESNMFGKSLYELVNEGLHAKLEHISDDSRARLSDTLSRVINEGSNGLICIIL
ncbi:MAG: stage IV sporulation protein A [Clostridia bacterium]|nr:stage IV sporulation protein A [Clostridia bacterium]